MNVLIAEAVGNTLDEQECTVVYCRVVLHENLRELIQKRRALFELLRHIDDDVTQLQFAHNPEHYEEDMCANDGRPLNEIVGEDNWTILDGKELPKETRDNCFEWMCVDGEGVSWKGIASVGDDGGCDPGGYVDVQTGRVPYDSLEQLFAKLAKA